MQGGRDAKGWKLRGGNDALVNLSVSLSSLDVTQAGRYGVDLGSMGSSLLLGTEDEDVAATNHCVSLKGGESQLYVPEDGFTIPVPRFKDDIAALRQLADFGLPPLCVVRPTQVVQVFYGFGDASGKQFGATLSQNYNCKAQFLKAVKDKGASDSA